MGDGEKSALAVATIAFGVGLFFTFDWAPALALCAVWVFGLVAFFGSDG